MLGCLTSNYAPEKYLGSSSKSELVISWLLSMYSVHFHRADKWNDNNTGYGNQKSTPRRKVLKQGVVPTRNLPADHTKTKYSNRATKFHSPELQRGAPQNCFICNSMGVANEPRFCCGKCQVNLCLKPCFKVNLIFTKICCYVY